MNKALYLVLAMIGCSVLHSGAKAEVIASCGPSDGQAYFLESGVVSSADAGFQPDEITEGGLSLSVTDDAVDLLFRDATGQISSATGSGGNVVLLNVSDELIHVLVVYDTGIASTAESYIFDIDSGEVIWTQSRATPLISKAVVFRSACRFPMQ